MKVAYFTNQYPAISHTFIRREITALEERGLEIDRFSIRTCRDRLVDPDDIVEQERTTVILKGAPARLLVTTLGVAVLRPIRFARALAMSIRMGRRSERGLLRNLAYLAVACGLLRRVQGAGCDHVHVHFGTNPTSVALLCRMLGGPPYSFTVHGPEEFDKPWSISLPDKISHAAFVVAISSFGRSQLYRQCRSEQWSKIKVVRCGVDESYLDAAISPLADTRQLVCVGRLCEQKGQLLLIQAVARVRAAGEELELILVGDGEMRPEVESLIQQYGLQDSITITGWASGEEVREHLAASRALVLPSFAEGLPVVIMEALALGRPALTTYIAGIPELVEPGVCGWLVPAGSVEALAAAMLEALTMPVERLARMGEEGRRRIRASHDARTATEPLFEELSRRGKAGH